MSDVYHNIAPAYQTYALQTDDGVKEYKTKTYMIGNLNHSSKSAKKYPKNGKSKKYKKETENDSAYNDDDDDEYDDDFNHNNALGGGHKRIRKKTPDSMTNLIGNDSNDKLDMTQIDLSDINNAESASANDSDPQIH